MILTGKILYVRIIKPMEAQTPKEIIKTQTGM